MNAKMQDNTQSPVGCGSYGDDTMEEKDSLSYTPKDPEKANADGNENR